MPGIAMSMTRTSGRELVIALTRGLAGLGFADDLDFGVRLQEQAEAHADYGVVVHQHDANHDVTAASL